MHASRLAYRYALEQSLWGICLHQDHEEHRGGALFRCFIARCAYERGSRGGADASGSGGRKGQQGHQEDEVFLVYY